MSTKSTKERRGLGRLAEYSIVAVIVTLMALVLLPVVRDAKKNSHGPPGEMVPSEPPEERNRVRAFDLSMVLPENWEIVDFGDLESGSLFTYARGTPGRRTKALLNVHRGDIFAVDLAAFNAITFQGSQAYERMIVEREDTFDDPAWSRYTMYFQHDGQWWVVEYGVARECEALPPMVRTYINTILWDIEPSAKSGS